MSSETSAVFLRDLIDVNPKVKMQKGQSYPFVDMAAVKEWQRDVSMADIEPREFKGSGSKFESGDILLARITPCFENGKTAIAPPIHGPGHGSTEFIVIRPKDPRDHAFVYGLLRSPEFRSHAIGQMVGTSGRQRIPNDAVLSFPLELPGEGYRHRVTHLLGGVEDACSTLRNQNTVLEAIAQRLFRSWFVNFDPVHAKAAGKEPEAMSAELAALFPSEFEDSELGPIPKGWSAQSLDESITYLNGLALQKYPAVEGEPTLPVLKIAQLRAGRTDPDILASRKMRPEFVVQDGDIVFSWSGSLEIKVWTGGEAALNQHLFKVFSRTHPAWFCYQSTLRYLSLFREIAASKATTMGHIQRHHLTEAKIAVAPEMVMQRSASVFGPMQALIVQNGKVIKELEELRDHLLPRLISGKLSLEDAQQVVEEAMAV